MPGDCTSPDGPYSLVILPVKLFCDGLQDPIIVIDAGSGARRDCGRWHADELPEMGWLRPVKGGLVLMDERMNMPYGTGERERNGTLPG